MKKLNVLLVSGIGLAGVAAAYINESELTTRAQEYMSASPAISAGIGSAIYQAITEQQVVEARGETVALLHGGSVPVSSGTIPSRNAAKPVNVLTAETNSTVFHQGEITRENVRVGLTIAETMTVQYTLGIVGHVPYISGRLKWTCDDLEKELPYNLLVLLKLKTASGVVGYIKLHPHVPQPGKGYGLEVSGTLEWDNMVCGFPPGGSNGCYYQEVDARRLITEGRIVSFDLSG